MIEDFRGSIQDRHNRVDAGALAATDRDRLSEVIQDPEVPEPIEPLGWQHPEEWAERIKYVVAFSQGLPVWQWRWRHGRMKWMRMEQLNFAAPANFYSLSYREDAPT